MRTRPSRVLVAERRLPLAHPEAALVERLARDHAGQVQQAHLAQRLQVGQRADAAGDQEAPAHRLGHPPHLVEVEALEHAVAVHVGVDEARGAAALHVPDGVLAEHLGLARPAGHRHVAAAHVHTHQDARGEGGQRLVEQVRVGEGGGAEHHARRAGGQRAADRGDRAQAAAELHGHRQLARDALHVLEVGGLARACAVEVDHVQEARARLHERARGLERIVGVDGLLVEVTLAQPHGLAVADVDRRQEDHWSATKFLSSRSPSGPDFSGCDCSPYTGGCSTTLTNSPP